MARKKKAEAIAEATTETATQEQTLGLDEGEREAIYDSFDGTSTTETEEDETEDSADIETTEDSADIETTEDSTETEETEDSTETEEQEEWTPSVDEKEAIDRYKQKHGLVEAGALTETRGKYKATKVELETLKDEFKQALVELKTLKDQPKPDLDDDDGYEGPKIKALQARIAALEKEKSQQDNFQKQNLMQKRHDQLHSMKTKTNEELEKEGFPGFLFAEQAIVSEIQKRIKKDPENLWLNTDPEGWKLVYKDIFPEVKAAFMEQDKNDLFAKKNEVKKTAKLATKTGKSVETKGKKDEDKSFKELYKEYISDRRSTGLT